MDLSRLGLKLGGCNSEVAALQSDLYDIITIIMKSGHCINMYMYM